MTNEELETQCKLLCTYCEKEFMLHYSKEQDFYHSEPQDISGKYWHTRPVYGTGMLRKCMASELRKLYEQDK